ncbi:hypothetical protein JCM11251_004323 [Rhodosporidiobolus azoricus]
MPSGYSRIAQDASPPSERDLEANRPPSTSSPPLGSSSSSASAYPPPRPVDAFSYPPPLSSGPPVKRASLGASRKGKERAVETTDEAGGRGPGGLSFCVRFTDGQTDDLLDLWVGEKDSVKEVKRRIRLLRSSTLFTSPNEEDDPPTPARPRRLRLIQLGRLLPDGVLLVPYTNQLNAKRAALLGSQGGEGGGETTAEEKIKKGIEALGKGVGAIVSEARRRSSLGGDVGRGRDEVDEMERGEATSTPLLQVEEDEEGHGKGKGKGKEEPAEDTRIWLHCSVGEAEEDEGEGGGEKTTGTDSADEPSSQITPLTGFDRLLDSGFSPEDIANLRAEFRERRGLDEEDEEEDGGEGEANAEHRRALEEQWMSGLTGQEEALGDASAGGYTYSLLKGVCIGFFVPFLPLFFFRSQIFSKRMQMAIVLGIVMNLAFGLLRFLG